MDNSRNRDEDVGFIKDRQLLVMIFFSLLVLSV